MSNTNIHKLKGKFNNGLLKEIPTKLENFFERHNNDWGAYRKLKKELKNKIAEKELRMENFKDSRLRISSYENILYVDDTYTFKIDNLVTGIEGFKSCCKETVFTDVVYNGKLLKEDERKELWNKIFNSPQKT